MTRTTQMTPELQLAGEGLSLRLPTHRHAAYKPCPKAYMQKASRRACPAICHSCTSATTAHQQPTSEPSTAALARARARATMRAASWAWVLLGADNVSCTPCSRATSSLHKQTSSASHKKHKGQVAELISWFVKHFCKRVKGSLRNRDSPVQHSTSVQTCVSQPPCPF